jgi:hypothetical protein
MDADEVIPDKITVDRGNLKIKCCDCGFAMYKVEVAGEVYGSFVDYDTRDRGQIALLYCWECWGKLKGNADSPMREAIARRRALESNTREDEKSIEDKKNEHC